MPNDRTMKIAEFTGEYAAMTDIDIVLEPSGRARPDFVMIEFTRLDRDLVRGVVAGQDALLIVVEIAAAAFEDVRFEADSRAIAAIGFRDRAARELDSFHINIISVDDPNSFSRGGGPLRIEMRVARSAAEHEIVCGPR